MRASRARLNAMRSVCAALIGALAVAPPASAAPDKARRPAGARGREHALPTSSPAAPAPERPADKPEHAEGSARATADAEKNAQQARESAELERMLEERRKLLAVRRKEAIAQLTRFIEHEPEDSSFMAEALLRLAELRWELARIDAIAAYENWQKTPGAERPKDAPVPNVDAALELYDRILNRHPNFDRIDLVLYMKAYALVEAGRTREALFSYRRIIDEFPSSRFQPDAHMAFAEWYFFSSYDYAAALDEFEQVIRYKQSELSDLALFKSAWCLWKLGRSKEAATRFRRVLDLGAEAKALSAERKRRVAELQDEALEYLIQVFTEDDSNTAADLHGFLREIGGEKYAIKMLARLSRAFFDQARYERAVQAYSMLLQSEPDAPLAPEYQSQIAAAYAAHDDSAQAVEALTQLAHNYRPKGSWAQHQTDPRVIKNAAAMAERALRTQALRFHERAQKENQAPDYAHAAALYRVHMREFPDSAFAYEMAFYLGEILFHHQDEPKEAAAAYLQAARINPKGPLTRDALYNAVLALERARDREPKDNPDPEVDRAFADAMALYLDYYPDDPEVPGMLFRQGKIAFDHGQYDPAVRTFGQLLERYPRSEYATTAGELVLESFNHAHDYRNIDTWARKLKTAPAFASKEAQQRLDALILQAAFKIGEELAAQGQYAESAQAYLKAAREFPHDPRAPKAYFNAGQQYQHAGNFEAAAGAYNELIAQFPGTDEGAVGTWAAAQMFEAIVQFKDAARYYEMYSELFPRGEKRADALYNAVVLQVSAGEYADAARNGKRFAELFPRHESAGEVAFLAGRADEAAERWDAAASVYRQYAEEGKNQARRVEANTRLAQVLLKKNDRAGAERALRAATEGKRHGAGPQPGVYFAAQARFMQGDLVLADFARIRIEGERATLGKRLQQKSELLRKAAAIYAQVVEYRVAEWVTAALFKIGESYELFAEALRSAPVPSGLNADQEQAYRDQLAMFIVPIEERALSAYEGGYHKALELRVFNHWTQKLREGLTRLNPVEYPALREIGADAAADSPLAEPNYLSELAREAEPKAGSAASKTSGVSTKSQSSLGKPQAAAGGAATPARPTPAPPSKAGSPAPKAGTPATKSKHSKLSQSGASTRNAR